jgi:hypothetical protein
MTEEKSAWKKWKENAGDTRPWDLLNPKTVYASQYVQKERMDICKGCPELMTITKQCKACGCFMFAKTKLRYAECPLKKW